MKFAVSKNNLGGQILYKSQALLKTASMLSVKSGSVGGRAMHEIAWTRPPYYSWMESDSVRNFNFGHEHPDAGSFVYIPDNGLTI